jgi:hypothetical protein
VAELDKAVALLKQSLKFLHLLDALIEYGIDF